MEREVKILSDLPLSDLISAPLNAVINAQAAAAFTTVDFIQKIGLINKTQKKRSIFDTSRALTNNTTQTDNYDVRVARLNVEKQTFIPEVKAVAAVAGQGEEAFPDGMKKVDGSIPAGAGANPVPNDGNHDDGLPKYVAAVAAVAPKDAQLVTTSEKIELPFLSLVPIPSFEVSELNWDFNVKLNSISEFSTAFTHSDETTAETGGSGGLDIGILSIGGHMNVKSTVKNDFELRYGSTHEAEYNLKISMKASAAKTPLGIERLLGIAEKIATGSGEAVAKYNAAKKLS